MFRPRPRAPAPASAVFRLPRFGGGRTVPLRSRLAAGLPTKLQAGSQASPHCIQGHVDPPTRPISCFETSQGQRRIIGGLADPSIPPTPHPMSVFETSKSRPLVTATARRITANVGANHASKHSALLTIPPRRPPSTRGCKTLRPLTDEGPSWPRRKTRRKPECLSSRSTMHPSSIKQTSWSYIPQTPFHSISDIPSV